MSTLPFARNMSAHIEPSRSTALRSQKKGWSRGLKAILAMGTAGFVLCCLAIGFGRIRSTPTAAASFGLARCDDVVCFRGLVPGKTAWSQAVATVGNPSASPVETDSASITLGQSTDHELLDSISIELPPQTIITVADVIDEYGVPCQIYLYSRPPTPSNTITLAYPGLRVQTDIVEDRLKTETAVRHLYYSALLATPQDRAAQHCSYFSVSSAASVMSGWRSWRGFASLQRYWN